MNEKIYKKIEPTLYCLNLIRKNGFKEGIAQFKELKRWTNKKVRWGRDFPDKTFYVIRRHAQDIGIFSFVMSATTAFRFCEENGYIPVIDWCNNKNIYLTDENVSKINAWELFLEQPAGYTLDDIKHAKNVIINHGGFCYGRYGVDIFSENFETWKYYCNKYIKFNKVVTQRFEEVWNSFFNKDDVICGTLCRGKAYTEDHPAHHPIQPDIDDVIDDIKFTMEKYGCNKIYLATENKEAYDILKSEFGDSLCSVADFTDTISEMPSEQSAKTEKGINYAVSVLILAHADCLVAGNTSGTISARLLSDGYKYEHVFDLGLYPD